MAETPLSAMTVEDLVTRFAEFVRRQNDGSRYVSAREQDTLGMAKRDVLDELRSRPGDQRIALSALYDDPDRTVGIGAMVYSLAVAPAAVRQRLEDELNAQAAQRAAESARWAEKAARRPPHGAPMLSAGSLRDRETGFLVARFADLTIARRGELNSGGVDEYDRLSDQLAEVLAEL